MLCLRSVEQGAKDTLWLNLRDCQEMAAIYWNKRPIEDVLNKRIRELEAELLQMKQEIGEE